MKVKVTAATYTHGTVANPSEAAVTSVQATPKTTAVAIADATTTTTLKTPFQNVLWLSFDSTISKTTLLFLDMGGGI